MQEPVRFILVYLVLPLSCLAAGFVGSLLFNALPLLQETWMCVRARRAP